MCCFADERGREGVSAAIKESQREVILPMNSIPSSSAAPCVSGWCARRAGNGNREKEGGGGGRREREKRIQQLGCNMMLNASNNAFLVSLTSQ